MVDDAQNGGDDSQARHRVADSRDGRGRLAFLLVRGVQVGVHQLLEVVGVHWRRDLYFQGVADEVNGVVIAQDAWVAFEDFALVWLLDVRF
jgi:hypothetical protein